MKALRLKIYSLFMVIILTAGSVFAYQTLAFDFPNGAGNWHVAYHRKLANETIVQYVPLGETYAKWSQTFVIHVYHNAQARTPLSFLRRITAQMEALNSLSEHRQILSRECIVEGLRGGRETESDGQNPDA